MANNTKAFIISMKVLEQIRIAVKAIIVDSGVKSSSELAKSIEAKQINGDMIALYALDYLKFLESGKKRFAKKIPIVQIIKFINKNSISAKDGISKNALAYIIQNAIFQRGIKAKKINQKITEVSTRIIVEQLEKQFDIDVENNIILKIK